MRHILDPVARDVVRACYAAADADSLHDRVLPRLRRVVPTDAAFFALLDPQTVLFTRTWTETPLEASGPRFLDNEFAETDDVNRFADLARARVPVATLDRATRGDWRTSARWREILAPLGLGDELRIVLRVAGSAWGVLCLHRAGATPFSAREAEILRQVGPHLAEAIRRLTARSPDAAAAAEPQTGVVVIEGSVVTAITDGAASWMGDLGQEVEVGGPAPLLMLALVRRLEALERCDPSGAVATATVTTRRGAVLDLHAAPLRSPNGGDIPAPVVVTLMSASVENRVSRRIAACRLTPAQRRVASLVVRGRSTKEIMATLRIGEHTVQDHLKAIFERAGVRTRRELVASLLR